MNSKLKSFLLLLVLFAFSVIAEDHINLNIGQIQNYRKPKNKEFMFFKLKIPSSLYDPSKDLIVTVFSTQDKGSDPDVYISKV
jgi:hypothetical protein